MYVCCAQQYSRDLLVFLFCILTLVAWITGSKRGRVPMLLNRPQTEEWKGWMQVRSSILPRTGHDWQICTSK